MRISDWSSDVCSSDLSYLHKPVLPGIQGLIRLLGIAHGTYSQHAMAHGYLPLNREISLAMQSHPVRWPMPEGGHILRPGTLLNTSQTAFAAEPCAGLWCTYQQPADGSLPRPDPKSGMSGPGTTPRNEHATTPLAPPAQEQANIPDTTELAVTPDDPACGLTLCCTPA